MANAMTFLSLSRSETTIDGIAQTLICATRRAFMSFVASHDAQTY
jgi:hypothetical protein